jgi:hypothetical protein
MWVPRDEWNLADKNRIGMLVSAGLWVSGGEIETAHSDHLDAYGGADAGRFLSTFKILIMSPRAFMIGRAAVCLFIIY